MNQSLHFTFDGWRIFPPRSHDHGDRGSGSLGVVALLQIKKETSVFSADDGEQEMCDTHCTVKPQITLTQLSLQLRPPQETEFNTCNAVRLKDATDETHDSVSSLMSEISFIHQNSRFRTHDKLPSSISVSRESKPGVSLEEELVFNRWKTETDEGDDVCS